MEQRLRNRERCVCFMAKGVGFSTGVIGFFEKLLFFILDIHEYKNITLK